MAPSHLKSLQALDMALREGSLSGAAEKLEITAAAVGQRIKTLEEFLGVDLLVRGRSGLKPTLELQQALPDLRAGFDALDRAMKRLNFQRTAEIHVVAAPDLAEFWLEPRLKVFRAEYPKILFCINGRGDVPVRLGAPDVRIEAAEPANGEVLFRDVFLPITGPDNTRRIADREDHVTMEGMPLLHLKSQRNAGGIPGWIQWFAKYGHREVGPDRGIHYSHTRDALEAVRRNVGFLVCGLSFVLQDIAEGRIVLPFPGSQHLPATHPYVMRLRQGTEKRIATQRFAEWLLSEGADTRQRLDDLIQCKA